MMSSFPFPWLLGEFLSEKTDRTDSAWNSLTNVFRLMRVLRFLRILRLVRLAKLKVIFVRIEDYIASTTLANIFLFIRLMFVIFFLAHWTACLWYYVSVNEMLNTNETWVSHVMDSSEHRTFDLYVTAIYFTFSTMSTVGYGDVHPYSRNEKIFGILTMVLACAVFAYTVGSIGSLITKSSFEESEHRSRVISVNRYMKKKDVPGSTQFRVRRYLEYLWDNQKKNFLKEREIIGMLSASLRDEIYSWVHGSILLQCPVFQDMEEHLLSKLSKLFEGETFAPGDVIFTQGQLTTKMYFVQNGRVTIYHGETDSHFMTLGANSFFGEIAFFANTPRCASASCLNFVDLFSISRSSLLAVAEELPISKERLDLLVTKCAHGEVTSLHIHCYICGVLGHVATRCSRVLINFDHEYSKRKWLDSRSKQSKFVNPYLDPNPNVERFKRPKLKISYEARQCVGKRRDPDTIFVQEPQILQLIKDFEEDAEEEQDFADRQMSVQSKHDALVPQRTRRPRFSIFVSQDPVDTPSPEYVRRVSFRKSLMKKAPIIEMESYEVPERSHSIAGHNEPFTPLPDDRFKYMRTEVQENNSKVSLKETESFMSDSDYESEFSPGRTPMKIPRKFLE